jgi:hypothetical protein
LKQQEKIWSLGKREEREEASHNRSFLVTKKEVLYSSETEETIPFFANKKQATQTWSLAFCLFLHHYTN